jgi:hypothetical protein
VNLLPMLFDILTVAFFVAGCLLLWLNLRPRRRNVLLTPKETADPWMEARRPGEFTAREPAEPSAEYASRPLDAPSEESEESFIADTAHTVDQNSYAGRVATAMMKLRSQR